MYSMCFLYTKMTRQLDSFFSSKTRTHVSYTVIIKAVDSMAPCVAIVSAVTVFSHIKPCPVLDMYLYFNSNTKDGWRIYVSDNLAIIACSE